MPLKPIQPSALLRQLSPRSFSKSSSSFFAGNRFSHLRDDSPGRPANGRQVRDRSASLKRKLVAEFSYADAVGKSALPPEGPVLGTDDINAVSANVAKVSSLCDKLTSGIGEATFDPTLQVILTDLTEAIRITNKIQNDIFITRGNLQTSFGGTQLQAQNNMVSLGAVPKRPRTIPPRDSSVIPKVSQSSAASAAPSESSDSPELANFKETVREAEKSTLVFNLDMGTVPLMNTTTMSKKATLALTKMAAKVEGKPDSTPSMEAIAAIDDLLSVTKGMEFFGRTTKTYRNSRDPDSGAFCTIPVKYVFKDRDTRMKAEQILSSRCKVNCSTPYPTILRECIKQTAEHFKDKYPGDLIRVSVITNKFALKVMRKPAGDNTVWSELDRTIPLPADALNVLARSVSKDFVMPMYDNRQLSEMDIVPTTTPGRLSRKDTRKDTPPRSRVERLPSS